MAVFYFFLSNFYFAPATIIGIYYLAFFAGNNLVGWIGGFLEKMPATQFWLLHAALAGIAGVTFPPRRQTLRPSPRAG